jgi:hypothetical protein
VTLCRPLPYGLHATPVERGRLNPRKGYGRLPRARMRRCRDVGLVERVSSANSGPVRPSPPLCCHPEYCNTIPVAVGPWDDKTSPSPPLYILRPCVSYTFEPAYGQRLKRKVPTQPPSKPLLGGHRTRHDAHWERDSSGRPTTPRRCTPYRYMYLRTARHDCKPPPLGL